MKHKSISDPHFKNTTFLLLSQQQHLTFCWMPFLTQPSQSTWACTELCWFAAV